MPRGKTPARGKGKKAAQAVPAQGTRGPALVIVESPAKERTISRFLSAGSYKGKYLVRSSYGHVRDLPPKKIGVELDGGFAPQYVLLPRAKKIMAEFKPIAERAASVFLATDHDREGESIAWHLVEILKLPEAKVRRITFHEITPRALAEALAAPRKLDFNLVHAQQARRVIDRLVGYKLSPLLWEKIQSGLSAGRVQSVAVRLLSERESEITGFLSEKFWTLGALVQKPAAAAGAKSFEARLWVWKGERVETTKTFDLFAEPYRVKVTSLAGAEDVAAVEKVLNGASLKVSKVERKETRRGPPPPFTTSTLQQAAASRLYFPAERTMRVAQSLYEGVAIGGEEAAGLITYMRTDSVFVSQTAAVEAARFIKDRYGAAFAPAAPPVYQTKTPGAQEAHEAIRPTGVTRLPEEVRGFLEPEQAKLYDLIWRRFVSSQMSDAVYDTLAAEIEFGAGEGGGVLRAAGRTLKFEGFLRTEKERRAPEPQEEAEEAEEAPEPDAMNLPMLEVGDPIELLEARPEQHQSSPPPHYNEASLIRAMERHGIGRPSTYAPTIKTIMSRGYVRRSKDRKLLPSDLGTLVTDNLKKHFPDVVSLSYTARVEERLDAVAEGAEPWAKVVDDFYNPFAKALETAAQEMVMSRPEPKLSGQMCPLCGTEMLIRESRFGKYLSCSKFPRCKGKIPLDAEGKPIVPEKTGELCDLCGKEMVIRTGRKGRFMACSGYPQCRCTFSLDAEGKKIPGSRPVPTDRKCQKCQHIFWLRLGKRGFFLACSGFPKCRNIKPVPREEGEAMRVAGEAARLAQRSQPGP